MRSTSERLLHGVLNSRDALPLGTDGDIVVEVALRNHVHATEFDDHPHHPQHPGALHERVIGQGRFGVRRNGEREQDQQAEPPEAPSHVASSDQSHVLLLAVAADLYFQLLPLPLANQANPDLLANRG